MAAIVAAGSGSGCRSARPGDPAQAPPHTTIDHGYRFRNEGYSLLYDLMSAEGTRP